MLGSAEKGFAQSEVDILRYSRTDFGGTARTMGFAGANVALGGDASSMHSNPAGLGLFRRSEITVSAAINFNEVSSQVYGSEGMNSRNSLNIPSFTAVFATRKADEEEGDWRSGSFGVSFTRINNFNQNIFYQGTSPANGLKFAEYSAQRANFKNAGLTSTGNPISIQDLAFDTRLIRKDEGLIDFYGDRYKRGLYSPDYLYIYAQDDTSPIDSVVRYDSSLPFKESIASSGSQNQWDLSYGASFRDKIFLGASLGITSINYKQVRVYSESNEDLDVDLMDLTLKDNLTTEGTGISLKLGAIFIPSDVLRLGISIQTPTWYTLLDRYNTNLTVNYRTGTFADENSFYAFTDPGEYEYNLTTPFKASGGAAFFFGKNGFISADVEYVDYSNGQLNTDNADDEFSQAVNQTTKNLYQSAINYRLGAEGRFDIFRIRGGFGYYGDPIKEAYSSADQSKTFLTGGIGIKQTNYFIDAALVYSTYKSQYSPYSNLDPTSILITPVVTSKHTNTNFVTTFGWSF